MKNPQSYSKPKESFYLTSGQPSHRVRAFDKIRLLCALGVLFSHAYVISNGSDENEPLVQFLGPDNSIGDYAVLIFFMLSGYLISGSLSAQPTTRHYISRRIRRIYPALILCGFVTAFIICVPFLKVHFSEYLLSIYPYKYIFAHLTLRGGFIPQVAFFEGNGPQLARNINGSLWSILPEVECYIILFFIWKTGRLAFLPTALLSGLLIISYGVSAEYQLKVPDLLFGLPAFMVGVMYFKLKTIIRPSISTASMMIVLSAIAAKVHWLLFVFPVPAGYFLFILTELMKERTKRARKEKVIDISYGTYLYGWPIEQAVSTILGDLSTPWLLFCCATPPTLILAAASWYIVERRALNAR
jgi:peptidoglycan/LPS O-acetylase OafA/YrhL